MTALASSQYLETTPVNTGGKTMSNKTMSNKTTSNKTTSNKSNRSTNKTGTRGRGTFLRNWSKQKPGYHQRSNMMKTCGKKCFLGPRKTFPICTKNTCKRNRKGIYAAYIRSEEYKTIKPSSQKYRRISVKARKLLRK